MTHRLACLAAGLAAFVLIGWAAGALWTSIVGSGDLTVVREAQSLRSPGLTSAARAVTWLGSSLVLVPLALACCVALLRLGLRRQAAALALSLGGAILLGDVVKLLVNRPRPPVEHLQAVSGPSFPSGHAIQAGAFWTTLALALRATRMAPRRVRAAGAAALTIVVAVALSRVYLGVHYLSDAIAGALLGAGWAILVARCLERKPREREPHEPEPYEQEPRGTGARAEERRV